MGAARDFCKAQVQRWMGLREFPVERQPRIELIEALLRHARSDDHAKRIVDTALERSEFCPTPAGIRELAGEVASGVQLPQACQRCKGEPWIVVERAGNSGAARCDCARGQWFRTKDRERAAKGAA